MQVERLEPPQLAQLLAARAPGPLRRALEAAEVDAESVCLALMEGDQLEGGLTVEYLAFDSAIFGARIGRISAAFAADADAYELLYAHIAAEAREHGYQQLLRRVAADEMAESVALQRAGFGLVDVSVTLRHGLDEAPGITPPGGVMIRPATDSDVERLMESCATVYRKSYLYRDPFYDHAAADELHRRWLRNCHHGGRATVVLAALIEGAPVAYIACIVDEETGRGVIDLLGVAAEYRRRGVAGQLISAALEFFMGRTSEVNVTTQLINHGAIALYQRLGFLLCESNLTFTRSEAPRRR